MQSSRTIRRMAFAFILSLVIGGAAPAPARAADGPWNHRVLTATSPDGLRWTLSEQSLVEWASVPELFPGPDGQPILLYVDATTMGPDSTLGAMVRGKDGKWRPAKTNLREVDPNVIRLKDGSYRAYVKSGLQGAMHAYASKDGLQWQPVGEVFRDARYQNATDPDVFETPDGWVMLVSLGPRMLRCTSPDGLKFTTDGTVLELGGSVSDTVKVNGGWRTYFHVNPDMRTGESMRIRSAFTREGKTWQAEEGNRVAAAPTGASRLGVGDAAPMQLPDGTWLMAVKSFIEPMNFANDRRENNTPRNPMPGGGGGNSPSEHRVLSATSKDGLTWTRDEGVRLARASVPCFINDGDRRILMYFVQPPEQQGMPETVACAVSTDGMNFVQDRAFKIEGLSMLKAVDPSILKDATGKFRLYYLASNHRGDPASGTNPHTIHLATSEDGIRFRETGSVFEYNDLVDPDVFQYQGRWFMYVFGKGGTTIATSADGLRFKYEKVMSPPGWGTTAPFALSDGRLRLYAFDQRTPIGNSVRSFISTNGLDWVTEAGDRLKANADEQITDPYVIRWQGGYKMYFKTSPARDAGPSNNPGRNANAGRPPNDGAPGQGQGQGQPRAGNNNPPGPQPGAAGPWDADVIVYRANAQGAVEKSFTFERAGVPTIARMKDGRLIAAHQYFPENDRANFDKVAVHFSSDDGRTWSNAEVIRLTGLPQEMRFPFDPTLVPLPDGRVRMYFTSLRGRQFSEDRPAIHSAVSTNGVDYEYEPGARFGIEGRPVIDCAAVLHKGVFHLYSPDNGTQLDAGQQPGQEPAANRPRDGVGYHATSTDGLNFTRQDDVKVEGRRRWLGNAQSDGERITFFGTGDPVAAPGTLPRGSLWMATSTDGKSWTPVKSPLVFGGDPGAVMAKDGSLIIVITGEPRAGTASAQKRRR